jgi:hypothetical protein
MTKKEETKDTSGQKKKAKKAEEIKERAPTEEKKTEKRRTSQKDLKKKREKKREEIFSSPCGKEKELGPNGNKEIGEQNVTVTSDGSFLLKAKGGKNPVRLDGKSPAGGAAIIIPGNGNYLDDGIPIVLAVSNEWLLSSVSAELHAMAMGVLVAARLMEFRTKFLRLPPDPRLNKEGSIPRLCPSGQRVYCGWDMPDIRIDSRWIDPLREVELECRTDSTHLRAMMLRPGKEGRCPTECRDWEVLRICCSRFKRVWISSAGNGDELLDISHTLAKRESRRTWEDSQGKKLDKGKNPFRATAYSRMGPIQKKVSWIRKKGY